MDVIQVNMVLHHSKMNLSFLKTDSSSSVLLNSIFQSAYQISSFPPTRKKQSVRN